MAFSRKSPLLALIISAFSLLAACSSPAKDTSKATIPTELTENYEVATLAGGCFWCMEPPFEDLEGVQAVISGFSGGEEVDPSYQDVAYGRTGHTESVQIYFDPSIISYEEILGVYWRQIDPTDLKGQFVDRGPQYRPEIFVHSSAQRKVAEESRKELEESGRFNEAIVVPVTDFVSFYPAEEYHQDFYKKSPQRYYGYRKGSGRDQFIESHWKD
ncbi:peptide-methionine (S)-S-oxide reductase MsrA [Puniceicoccus vermicola]|uniref:Peptide methionine sulfoxide reductase MsrA n=1 Tax=Puniceicoccus vermicola TaxID=388746 RepID=A0A7X1E5S2_9BACT|nr:peptide-methionine (S)-S-oxide reductase MsrA [Puniceicoccus vermicola]MBC2603456.1 peptide-methionine (S)-S-oxide reductase MsrA [Puniceicoccus vermicola]